MVFPVTVQAVQLTIWIGLLEEVVITLPVMTLLFELVEYTEVHEPWVCVTTLFLINAWLLGVRMTNSLNPPLTLHPLTVM
jgi:hypothetical protein